MLVAKNLMVIPYKNEKGIDKVANRKWL